MTTIVFYVNTTASLPDEVLPADAEVHRIENDSDVDMVLMDNLHGPMPDRMLFVGGSDAAELAKLNHGQYVAL